MTTSNTPKVKVGSRLPYDDDLYFGVLNKGEDAPKKVPLREVFQGKKVVLFGLPGAFTSLCSSKHLPQFIDKSKELRAKGVDTIACTAVNDPYVLREWSATFKSGEEVLMLSDGEAVVHRGLGLTQNIPLIGERGVRYSMFVDDGLVKVLNIEEPGPLSYKVSGPEHMLKDLENLGK